MTALCLDSNLIFLCEGGNPSLTWQNGRELASYSDANYDITYTYDVNGMRTSKVINDSSEVNYVYENGLLLQMDFNGYIFDISYDVNGSPIGFRLDNGSYYYYGTNSRGDIIAIYNQSGTKLATYSYDAYGKFLGTTYTSTTTNYNDNLAIDHNPLRYRGYVYDRETGFYYLQTRYYDPTTCRFINGDSQLNTDSFTGYNMFAYCSNNPIIFIDPNGKDAILLYDDNFVGHIGALVEDENGDWWHFYWGTSGENYIGSVFNKDVTPYTWFESYTDKLSLTAINNSEQYGGTYAYSYYMVSNFSTCIDSFKNCNNNSYNLYSNNCSQVTTSILATADTPYSTYLTEASKKMIPVQSFLVMLDFQPTFFFTTDYKNITLKERLHHE